MNQPVRSSTTAKRGPGVWIFIPALAGSLYFASPEVRDFIGSFESGNRRVLVVYADKLAGGLPSVCDGLTRHVTTTPIIVGERWTDAKCETHERAVTITIQRELVKCFKIKPPQSVFEAATSHAWNFGSGKTCTSQSMKEWNRGNWAKGCTLLAYTPKYQPNWSHAGGVFYPGLHRRRKAEMKMCLAGLAA